MKKQVILNYLSDRYDKEMAQKKLNLMTRGQKLDLYVALKNDKDASAIADAIHVQKTTVPDYSHLDGPEVDHVKVVLDHLTKEHGETEAKAKIRAMSGLELIKLSEKLRRDQEVTITENKKTNKGHGVEW
jgi:hypothetical protein